MPLGDIHCLTGIFTLRTFALYGNNWAILIALTVLGVARVAITFVSP